MSKWRKSFSFLLWINLCHHGESAFNLPHFDYWSRQNKIENLLTQENIRSFWSNQLTDNCRTCILQAAEHLHTSKTNVSSHLCTSSLFCLCRLGLPRRFLTRGVHPTHHQYRKQRVRAFPATMEWRSNMATKMNRCCERNVHTQDVSKAHEIYPHGGVSVSISFRWFPFQSRVP